MDVREFRQMDGERETFAERLGQFQCASRGLLGLRKTILIPEHIAQLAPSDGGVEHVTRLVGLFGSESLVDPQRGAKGLLGLR